jgi:hypothetical protein
MSGCLNGENLVLCLFAGFVVIYFHRCVVHPRAETLGDVHNAMCEARISLAGIGFLTD